VGLDKSEFFISFVFQNLSEKCNFMVDFEVGFDAIDDSSNPLNDQTFETVLLTQIGVHKLFHGFTRKLAFHSLLIIL
jgi:hypothetical protein